MKHCMILVDVTKPSLSSDLLEAASRIYQDEAYVSIGVFLDPSCVPVKSPFDILCDFGSTIESYDALNFVEACGALHQTLNLDSILIPATPFGRMLAPRLAMHLGVGLVADVTDIHSIEGALEMIRPAYSGKLMAGIVKRCDGPLMMSIRQNTFTGEALVDKESARITIPFNRHADCGITLISMREKPKTKDIRDSEILISGGGGIIAHFNQLDRLAHVLNAQVSASRRVVDSGIAPRKIQVGQSGKTVSPRLYIALGIYGSLQHIEGLKNIEHLIAVNVNKDAPICSLADLVVEGDALEFIDRLTLRIQQSEIQGG